MDSTAASEMSAIWAALQAAETTSQASNSVPISTRTYAVAGFTDDAADEDDDDEEDEEEDDVDEDEMAPVMPQRVGGGLLPPSFYSTPSTGLTDVVPAFLLPTHRPFAGGGGDAVAVTSASHTSTSSTATTSSEMFLDDILRSHDEPFTAGAPHHGALPTTTPHDPTRLSAERLSQLEDNYERKKKRAKINRRDLNSRFQELMDLLKLKEDRKLNRAKVLEKAIEQIHKLTDELRIARQQLQRNGVTTSTTTTTTATPLSAFPSGPLQMPLPMPQWSPGATMASPMMWMPMLPTPRTAAMSSRPASARTRTNASKAAKTTTTTTTTISASVQTSPERAKSTTTTTTMTKTTMPTPPVRRPGLKRGRDSNDVPGVVTPSALVKKTPATLEWIAHEVPTLLEMCDAWTLRELLGVSRELRAASRRDQLWTRLCECRWKLDDLATDNALALWKQLDAANENPRCSSLSSPTTLEFASGRRGNVALWVSLVRRSNGRTTRTVLIDNKAFVRQVVELHVLVQNLDPSVPVRLTNELRVVTSSSSSSSSFELITCDARAHLAPHLVSLNDLPTNASVADVELFHGDACVLSVFVACDGLDLEQQFLDRVDGIEMQCERKTRDGNSLTRLSVAAFAPAHKHARIADAYGSTHEKSV